MYIAVLIIKNKVALKRTGNSKWEVAEKALEMLTYTETVSKKYQGGVQDELYNNGFYDNGDWVIQVMKV